MANPGNATDDGDTRWAVIRRTYLALAKAFRVVALGFDGSSYPAIAVDSDGNVQVDIVSGGGSGGGSTPIDDGDAVDTDTEGTLIMGATAVPGVAHPVKVAADGAVAVDVESMPTVTVTATDLDIRPLDSAADSVSAVVTSSVLPTGAATEATQLNVLAAVDGLEGLLGTSNTNTGAAATSLAIIDDWDESDRAKVNPIVGQAGVQGGSGAVSALTQRVVLATDVALPAGSNAIGTVTAVGIAAADAAATGNPVAVAWEGDDSIKAAMSTDGDVTRPWADKRGRPVVTSMYPGENASQVTTFTTGTAAAVTTNPASTHKLVIYAITVHNSSATKTTVDFLDGSGGTLKWSLPAAADCGGACITFPDGLPLTADNELFADPTTAVTTLTVSVLFKTVLV